MSFCSMVARLPTPLLLDVLLRLLDAVGIDVEAERSAAYLGGRHHDAAVSAAQIVDHVILGHLRQLQHLRHHLRRRRDEDHVRPLGFLRLHDGGRGPRGLGLRRWRRRRATRDAVGRFCTAVALTALPAALSARFAAWDFSDDVLSEVHPAIPRAITSRKTLDPLDAHGHLHSFRSPFRSPSGDARSRYGVPLSHPNRRESRTFPPMLPVLGVLQVDAFLCYLVG